MEDIFKGDRTKVTSAHLGFLHFIQDSNIKEALAFIDTLDEKGLAMLKLMTDSFLASEKAIEDANYYRASIKLSCFLMPLLGLSFAVVNHFWLHPHCGIWEWTSNVWVADLLSCWLAFSIINVWDTSFLLRFGKEHKEEDLEREAQLLLILEKFRKASVAGKYRRNEALAP